MTGTHDLFDATAYTASSEYAPRYGTKVDTLQIHHATMTSLSGLIALMQPGGRQMSANGAMGNTGHLVEVVPLSERAFTSASPYDRRSLTVECCNTTLSPEWGISDAVHERLARLAADMWRAGLLGGLDRRYIIGHREVPGTYATACPGPSMNLDRIVARARELARTAPASTIQRILDTIQEGEPMFYRKPDGKWRIGDLLGVADIADLTDDPSYQHITKPDLIAAAKASGRYVEIKDQAQADHLEMILRRRGAQNLAAIAAASGAAVE